MFIGCYGRRAVERNKENINKHQVGRARETTVLPGLQGSLYQLAGQLLETFKQVTSELKEDIYRNDNLKSG